MSWICPTYKHVVELGAPRMYMSREKKKKNVSGADIYYIHPGGNNNFVFIGIPPHAKPLKHKRLQGREEIEIETLIISAKRKD